MTTRFIPSYTFPEVESQVEILRQFHFFGLTVIEVNDSDAATVDRIVDRISGKRELKLKRNFKRK